MWNDAAERPSYPIHEVRAAVRANGPFYHATSALRYEQIHVDGLLPARADGAVSGVAGRPVLCYSPFVAQTKWLRKMQTRFDGAAVVLLEIPADVLADLDIAIDYTSNEWWYREHQYGVRAAAGLLAAGVDVFCFEPVPPEHIVEVVRLPERPARECLAAQNDPVLL